MSCESSAAAQERLEFHGPAKLQSRSRVVSIAAQSHEDSLDWSNGASLNLFAVVIKAVEEQLRTESARQVSGQTLCRLVRSCALAKATTSAQLRTWTSAPERTPTDQEQGSTR